MKFNAEKKTLSKAKWPMTNMRGGQEDVTATEILDERVLWPTLGDVTLSDWTEDDIGQRSP